MMVSKYGGITLEDYFIDTVLKDRSFKKMESAVFELLKKMKQLFIGLNEIYKIKIYYGNIMEDTNSSIYVQYKKNIFMVSPRIFIFKYRII